MNETSTIGQYRTAIRFSFPSKLSTYVAAGKPVLFHGPEESSVTSFFERYPVGVCCHSLETADILASLKKLMEPDFHATMVQATQRAFDEQFDLRIFRNRFAALLGIDPGQLTGKALMTPEQSETRSVFNHFDLMEPTALLPESIEGQLMPDDPHLLERARTQWQFGDWDSLGQMTPDFLEHHPDRARLAVLAAAGHAQRGALNTARECLQRAEDWGCDKMLIRRILIAGVHDTLGRAAALMGRNERAARHFAAALETGMPGSDLRLLLQPRVIRQSPPTTAPPARHS